MHSTAPTTEALQKKLDSLSHQLELVSMVTNELNTELDLDKLLSLVAVKAREVINAETLVVPVINFEGSEYTYKAAAGQNSEYILNQTFPISVGMCGWVLSNKKSLIFGKNLPWLMNDKTNWEQGMESALLIPLMARGKIVGGLSGLGKTNGESFTQEDHDLLQVFANQVSIAIDNAKIFEELTEEKEQSETTLNSIGDAVITTDLNGMIVRMNPVACKLLGWSKQELIGNHLKDFFNIKNSDTGEQVDDPVERVISTGEIVGLTNHTVLIDRHGKTHQIADSAAPIRNEHNELLGVVLVFHDVTDEYILLEELRNSEQKHRRLVEHLGSEFFMFVQDVNKHYTYVSPSIKECLGYSSTDYMQNNKKYLTNNELNEQINIKFEEALTGKKPEPYEIEVVNQKNEICCLRVSKTPVINDQQQIIAIEGLVQNITKQRELEQSLRQSQKMEAVGQLSGGIAHDFNNQLGIVTGYLEMLKNREPVDTKEHRWIEIADKATRRCVDLTRNLLDFSRKKLVRPSVVNLNESLRSLQNIIEHSVTAKVDLKYELADDLWNATIDDGEFQDVVLNLVINSRDAMKNKGLLSLHTDNISFTEGQSFQVNDLPAGKYVKFSIIDTGEGISPEAIEHIFEPFFTTKDVGHGTGLGMAMVFGFVNRINGAIDVQSGSGIGTQINLYIPRTTQEKIYFEKTDEISNLPRGNETILLVEDEEALRTLAKGYLSGLGYQVVVANNGSQAIDMLKQEELNIDLLFSDVIMPGDIDGFALAECASQLRPGIKVLMATGYTSLQPASNSASENIKNILYKPYTRETLALRIRAAIN